MEGLEDRIRKFLSTNTGYGHGINYCHSHSGNNCSVGLSNIHDWGYGGGSGIGHGCLDGFGFGDMDHCAPELDSNYSIKEVQGHKVYIVDTLPTIITAVRGNIAQGFILHADLQLEPCYIVRMGNKYAHGNTLKKAYYSLQWKLYRKNTDEERIDTFKRKFPSYDTKYSNKDLFDYHSLLTDSCFMGRKTFVRNHNLSLGGKTTICEFVELTKDAYGGDVIRKLPKAYGIIKTD